VGSRGRRRHGKDTANRRAGNCISEKEFTKGTKLHCCDRNQGRVQRANCGRETGCGYSMRQKTTRCDMATKPAAFASASCQHEDADKLDCNISMALERLPRGLANLAPGPGRPTGVDNWVWRGRLDSDSVLRRLILHAWLPSS
jgi:hypothetical protein